MIYPKKLGPSVREYLAHIGARGGSVSRRELTQAHAKQMVVIREALRIARKKGRKLSARERKRLALRPDARSPIRRPRQIRRETFFHPHFS